MKKCFTQITGSKGSDQPAEISLHSHISYALSSHGMAKQISPALQTILPTAAKKPCYKSYLILFESKQVTSFSSTVQIFLTKTTDICKHGLKYVPSCKNFFIIL